MTIGMPLSNYLYCGANSDSDEGESTVRILVPIIALIIGAVFVLSMLKPIEPAIQKQASPNEIVQTQQPQDDESDAIAAVKDPSLVKQVPSFLAPIISSESRSSRLTHSSYLWRQVRRASLRYTFYAVLACDLTNMNRNHINCHNSTLNLSETILHMSNHKWIF